VWDENANDRAVSEHIPTRFYGARLRRVGTFYRVIAVASRVIGVDFEYIETFEYTVKRYLEHVEYIGKYENAWISSGMGSSTNLNRYFCNKSIEKEAIILSENFNIRGERKEEDTS